MGTRDVRLVTNGIKGCDLPVLLDRHLHVWINSAQIVLSFVVCVRVCAVCFLCTHCITMPFLGQDWRSPGDQWVRTSEGWERLRLWRIKVFENLNENVVARYVRNICLYCYLLPYGVYTCKITSLLRQRKWEAFCCLL